MSFREKLKIKLCLKAHVHRFWMASASQLVVLLIPGFPNVVLLLSVTVFSCRIVSYWILDTINK